MSGQTVHIDSNYVNTHTYTFTHTLNLSMALRVGSHFTFVITALANYSTTVCLSVPYSLVCELLKDRDGLSHLCSPRSHLSARPSVHTI